MSSEHESCRRWLAMALTWLAAVSFASQAKAEWSAQLFAREKSAETLARSAYTAPPRNNAKRPPGRHQDFPSVLKKRFRDDPHVAGQRSNYLPNQAVTPTGRSAALFTAKARGVNAYYLWFSTISVQALAPLLNVVPNEWKEPFSLYFEVEGGRTLEIRAAVSARPLAQCADRRPFDRTARGWPHRLLGRARLHTGAGTHAPPSRDTARRRMVRIRNQVRLGWFPAGVDVRRDGADRPRLCHRLLVADGR